MNSQRRDSSASHLQIRHIQYVACFVVNILFAVSKPEDLEDFEVAAKDHGNTFCSTFFVAGCYGAENRTPHLARLVPSRDRPPRNRTDGGVLDVEIILSWARLLQQLPRAMAQQFVSANLHFKCRVAVLSVQLIILLPNEGDRLIRRRRTQHISQTDILETKSLPDVIVVGNVDAGRDAGAGE